MAGGTQTGGQATVQDVTGSGIRDRGGGPRR